MPPYNKSVVEQFMSPEKIPVGWPWRLLIFSIVFAALVLFIYLGILWGYQPYLRSQQQSLDKKINAIGGAISEKDRQNFINFYSQIVNLQGLLKTHVQGSNILAFLEENTNQNVYYSVAALSVPDHSLRLEGVAKNYDSLVQQMFALNQLPAVAKVVLQQSQTSQKGASFALQIIFNPALLSFTPPPAQ